VDEPQTWSKRIGLTRGKAAIVGILAVTLLVLIYIQYGATEAADVSAGVVESPASRQAPKSDRLPADASSAKRKQLEPAATRPLSVAVDHSRWKSPELAVVLAYDPFAPPPGFPQPPRSANIAHAASDGATIALDAEAAAEELAEAIEILRIELEQLQQRGVHVIVRGRNQYVAMIGDRTIHVGERIGGFTVTAIEPDHVRVERTVQK
jgi:hypothetical protein